MPNSITLKLQHQLLTLPEIRVRYNGNTLTITNAILDTGSAGTLLDVNQLLEIGITATTGLTLETIYGVGGSDHVFTHEVTLEIQNTELSPFVVQVGAIHQYRVSAILGLDFLLATHAIIDLDAMTLTLRT